jgi:hypothetical protein
MDSAFSLYLKEMSSGPTSTYSVILYIGRLEGNSLTTVLLYTLSLVLVETSAANLTQS